MIRLVHLWCNRWVIDAEAIQHRRNQVDAVDMPVTAVTTESVRQTQQIKTRGCH